MHKTMANFLIINDFTVTCKDELHQLYQKMPWSNTRTRDDVDLILSNSISVGIVENQTNKLVGFARAVSDKFKYAFIFDVIVDEPYRGRGLGKLLVKTILAQEELKRVSVFELHCLPAMVSFYEKCGFTTDFKGVKALRLIRPVQ